MKELIEILSKITHARIKLQKSLESELIDYSKIKLTEKQKQKWLEKRKNWRK